MIGYIYLAVVYLHDVLTFKFLFILVFALLVLAFVLSFKIISVVSWFKVFYFEILIFYRFVFPSANSNQNLHIRLDVLLNLYYHSWYDCFRCWSIIGNHQTHLIDNLHGVINMFERMFRQLFWALRIKFFKILYIGKTLPKPNVYQYS